MPPAVYLLCADCHFGTSYQKPTYIWTNIEGLIAELQKGKKICKMGQYCRLGEGAHHHLGGGRRGGKTGDAAPFPLDLVAFLKGHILDAIQHRRDDDVEA